MKKLRLDLDKIAVESFATGEGGDGGTIHARESEITYCDPNTCGFCVEYSNGGCGGGGGGGDSYATCGSTCADGCTQGGTCAKTCDVGYWSFCVRRTCDGGIGTCNAFCV